MFAFFKVTHFVTVKILADRIMVCNTIAVLCWATLTALITPVVDTCIC